MDIRWVLVVLFLIAAIYVVSQGSNEYLLFWIGIVLLLLLFWIYRINFRTQIIIILWGFFFALGEYIGVAYFNFGKYDVTKAHNTIPIWTMSMWALFATISWVLIEKCKKMTS